MKYKVISKKKARVRLKPSLSSRTLGYLVPGSIIEIDKTVKSGKWCHRKKGGYVSSKLLRKITTTNNSTTKPQTKPESTVTSKPVKTNAQKLAEIATKLAYSTNTSKAKYPTGEPTKAYKAALVEAYSESERKKWKAKPWKAGASCGVFIGVCVRLAGIDKKFPHYTSKQWKSFSDKTKWKSIEPKIENMQNGDIIIYRHGKGGHVCMYCEGMTLEASYGDFWPKTTNSAKARLSKNNPKNKTNIKVYRAL